MLAGRLPFDAITAQGILAAQVLEVPVDIQQARTGTPPLLGDAIMRCLAKNPADRWQSADELIARLEVIGTTPSGGVTPTDTRPLKATGARLKGKGGKTARLIGAAFGVILIGAIIGDYVKSRGTGSGGGKIDKIGVMPIEDISGKDSVFVAAMHDALTSALTRANLASVETRSTMMRYKGGAKTIREVAKELSLGAVVEATVFRAGDVMRINVQFTNPVTSRALWSNTYEKNVKDVLAAQSEVVGLIASGIDSVLAGPKKPGDGK
jgi:TolB-like protein